MPETDREVFDRLTDGDAEPVEDFLTYAIFAFQRREWVRHFIARNNDMPEQADIDRWIGDLTDYDFDQMRTRAAAVFDLAARAYMAPDIEAAREEATRDALLREIRNVTDVQRSELNAAVTSVQAAGSFRTQLGIALLAAIIAPLIIGGLIVFALAFSDRFPSIRDLAHGAAPAVIGDKPNDGRDARPSEAPPVPRP